MKSLALCLILLSAVAVYAWWMGGSRGEPVSVAVAVPSDPVIDGGMASLDVTVRNNGPTDLHILRVSADCRCSGLPTKPIPLPSRTVVTFRASVAADAAYAGVTQCTGTQSMELFLAVAAGDDRSTLRVINHRLDVPIRLPTHWMNRETDFGQVSARKPNLQTSVLVRALEDGLNLVVDQHPEWTVDIAPQTAGQWRVRFAAKNPSKLRQPFQDTLTFRVTDADGTILQRIAYRLGAEISADIGIDDRRSHTGAVPIGAPLQEYLGFHSLSEAVFSIRPVDLPFGVTADPLPNEPRRFAVRFTPASTGEQRVQIPFEVTYNDGGRERVSIDLGYFGVQP